MSTKPQVQLEFTSRFKSTDLFVLNGKTFFGTWKPPQIKLDGTEKVIITQGESAGFLDKIAFEEYDDRTLWWAIALVNNIADVTAEVKPETKLVLPTVEAIRIALLAQENR